MRLDSPEARRTSARLRPRDEEAEFFPVEVQKMGPMGIELILDTNNTVLSEGDRVDIQILADGESSDFTGYIVCIKDPIDPIEERVVAIKFVTESLPVPDRRSNTRWLCPTEFLPLAVAPTPGHFNEFTSFQIRNISKDGLELRTDPDNQYLLKGTILRLSISLPLIGDTSAIVKILRIDAVSFAGNEALRIGAEFVDLDSQARELLSQYLLQFSNIDSHDEMRSANASHVSRSRSNEHTSFLKSAKEYEALSKLRADESKVSGASNPINDLYSRIVIQKRDGEVIAAMRITFPDIFRGKEDREVDWPSSFPRGDQLVEVSDIVLKPKLSPHNVLLDMLGYVASTCLSGQRPFLICYGGESYESVLLKTGFYAANGEGEVAYIGHPIDSTVGRGTSLLNWTRVWDRAATYLIESKTVVPKGVTRIMVKIYSVLGRFLSKLLSLT